MATKEEVIKEAWSNKEFNLKDGWFYIGYCCNGWDDVSEYLKCMEISIDRNNYDLDFYDHDNGDWGSVSVRPKSLQGIESNNGWIKIESEEDLPKENVFCKVFIDNEEKICEYYDNGKVKGFCWAGEGYIHNYKELNVTHYQTIIKSLPPLY